MAQANEVSDFVSHKADVLVRDGRLSFVRFYGPTAQIELWRVIGDTDVYHIVYDGPRNEYRCPCEGFKYNGICSHVIAISKVRQMVMGDWPA